MLLDLSLMPKLLEDLKHVELDFPKLRDKFERSDKSTRKKVFQVIIGGLVLLVLIIGGIFISNSVFPSGDNEIKQIEIDDHIHEEYKSFEDLEKLPEDQIYDYIEIPEEEQEPDAGRGIDLPSIPNPLDALNPFSGFQESVRDAFSEIIQQGLELFDDYVAFTPNIAKGDGDIVDARGNQISFGVNKFYNATRTIAFLLLPIVIVITGITIVLEGRMKGTQILMQSGKKVLLFMIAMVSLRFIFSLFIDLNNSISRYVLQTLVGLPGTDTLSESLLVAFGMNISDGKLEFSLEGALNLFGEIILWIGLFFLLMTLLFQFIIRFFHLLIHLIVFPIVLIISLLPGGGQFFKTYLEEVLRTIFMQPIFLIGIGIALEVISTVDEPIPKIVLGLGALSFLNIIPAIVNRFSGIMWGVAGAIAGGMMTATAIGSANKIKQGVVTGASGGKTNSVRNLAGRAIGEKIASVVPGGGTASRLMSSQTGKKSGSATLMSNQRHAGAFKQALKNGKSKSAFASLGMQPLSKSSLKQGGSKTLNKIEPDFSGVSKASLKDSESLSNKFINSNYDSFMGDYPMTEGTPSFGQLSDVSDFKAVNPQTHQLMNEIIQPTPTKVELGNTFDTSNDAHWNHVTEWYAKNESKTTGQPVEKFHDYARNPENKMNVLRRASSEGYFKAQGINTVKTVDQIQGQEPVNKYYQVQKLKVKQSKSPIKKSVKK